VGGGIFKRDDCILGKKGVDVKLRVGGKATSGGSGFERRGVPKKRRGVLNHAKKVGRPLSKRGGTPKNKEGELEK